MAKMICRVCRVTWQPRRRLNVFGKVLLALVVAAGIGIIPSHAELGVVSGLVLFLVIHFVGEERVCSSCKQPAEPLDIDAADREERARIEGIANAGRLIREEWVRDLRKAALPAVVWVEAEGTMSERLTVAAETSAQATYSAWVARGLVAEARHREVDAVVFRGSINRDFWNRLSDQIASSRAAGDTDRAEALLGEFRRIAEHDLLAVELSSHATC